MPEQASSRVVRLRYTGTFAHQLKAAGGLFAVDVRHGTEFDCPASFVEAIKRRGTPVEEVVETIAGVEKVPVEALADADAEDVADTLMGALEPGLADAAKKSRSKGRQRSRNEPEPPKGDDAG